MHAASFRVAGAVPEEYDHAMQLHSAVTSSSSLTGTPDDVPQLPVGQAPGSPGAVTRSARLASLHRAPCWLFFFFFSSPCGVGGSK